jgi:hypothetical protein
MIGLHLKTSKLKNNQILIYFTLTVILVVAFTNWLVIRDPRLVGALVGGSFVNEFQYIASFCDSLPLCYRFNSALLPNFVINSVVVVLDKMSIINDPYHSLNVSNSDRNILVFFIISTFYRLALLIATGYLIKKIFGIDMIKTLLFSICFFIINSAIIQTKFLTLFIGSIDEPTFEWLYRIQIMYLTFYDFLQPLIVLMIIVYLNEPITNKGKLIWFFIGFILTTFLDHAGLLAAIYMFIKYFKNKASKIHPSLFIFFGSASYLLLYKLMLSDDSSTGTSMIDLWQGYFSLNTERIRFIPILIFLILVLPSVSFYLIGRFSRKNLVIDNRRFLNYESDIKIMMTSLCILYLLSYFTSALTVEFGRITFAFQILSGAYFFLIGSQKNKLINAGVRRQRF